MEDRIELCHASQKVIGKINIPGSKSEANRLLILQKLFFPNLEIKNLSSSRDTQVLSALLESYKKQSDLSAQDAGTAMRFTTAFLATQNGEWTIDGTERMRQRPMGILVDALRDLGAKVTFLQKEGYPPLKIQGGNLVSKEIRIDGSVSSQYISALMLIGAALPEGLILKIPGFSVSTPYIYLTANIMRRLGIKVVVLGNEIKIPAFKANASQQGSFTVEPDWSAASYWYSMCLLAEKAEIYLPGFREHSLQGDSFVANLFAPLGVSSHFIGAGFRLSKSESSQKEFDINLIHNPDLAQTLAVAFAAKNYKAQIKGLQTLRIKETDRLEALKCELEKTGAKIEIGEDYLLVQDGIKHLEGICFESYNDHRMAMAFAPLALMGKISINNPSTVQKSYGSFWKDLEKVKFQLKKA